MNITGHLEKFTIEEKNALIELEKKGTITRDHFLSIRKKALYQIVWTEGKDHYSELSTRDEIEFLDSKEPGKKKFNKPIKFIPEKKCYSFSALELILKCEEYRKPSDWPGGYIKHKIALFDPETKETLFTVRYDMFCSSQDDLLTCMLY